MKAINNDDLDCSPFLSGLVHLLTNRTEFLENCFSGSTNCTI